MPRKPPIGKSLAELNPELSKEWHPIKNGSLTPYDVSLGSNKKVWWECEKGDDHIWESSINNRSNGRGCPVCSGHKVVLSNCLATLNPDLTKEWHPTKNKSLSPFDIVTYSNKKVWWKCNKGDDHEWLSSVSDRSRGNGCPVCVGQKVVRSNSLATLFPDLAKEWHPSKNGLLTPNDVTISTIKKVWWKCVEGDDHEWFARIGHRTINVGCPVCVGQKVVLSNCLATLRPDIAKEWHPTKNGSLTPFEVSSGTDKKVWWKCDKGIDHEWYSSINNRVNGNECGVCVGKIVVPSNCLATLRPDIAKEWHPTKNKSLSPFDIVPHSNKKVWWKCDKGIDHEWQSTINNRSKGFGCPFCTLTPQSKQELTITFELIQFFEINPKGFKTRVQGKLWTIDIYIPVLKLGIEFDGSYWHKDKRALDKLKTKKLEEGGFTIMRVRQEPLKAITEIDVISKIPFKAKQVTNDILEYIIDAYKIDGRKRRKIKNYLLKESIQNEKGLDVYIDMILTEKSERKNK